MGSHDVSAAAGTGQRAGDEQQRLRRAGSRCADDAAAEAGAVGRRRAETLADGAGRAGGDGEEGDAGDQLGGVFRRGLVARRDDGGEGRGGAVSGGDCQAGFSAEHGK